MNVFVLSTGRCGSVTFARACRHIRNYTSAHESQTGLTGPARVAYPDDHIEVDNRLSWFLGRLDVRYGDEAFYVHLTRDPEAVAASFARRYGRGVIAAYAQGILHRLPDDAPPLAVCRDYVDTVNTNIAAFLKDKTQTMALALETAEADFARFWAAIGAEGDREAAMQTWTVPHNASDRELGVGERLMETAGKLKRVAKGLPDYVKRA